MHGVCQGIQKGAGSESAQDADKAPRGAKEESDQDCGSGCHPTETESNARPAAKSEMAGKIPRRQTHDSSSI